MVTNTALQFGKKIAKSMFQNSVVSYLSETKGGGGGGIKHCEI